MDFLWTIQLLEYFYLCTIVSSVYLILSFNCYKMINTAHLPTKNKTWTFFNFLSLSFIILATSTAFWGSKNFIWKKDQVRMFVLKENFSISKSCLFKYKCVQKTTCSYIIVHEYKNVFELQIIFSDFSFDYSLGKFENINSILFFLKCIYQVMPYAPIIP